MNKTRIPVVIITVALFATAILALQTYSGTIKAVGSNPSSSGMGDLRFFESQQNAGSVGALEKRSSSIGMGDLRFFEAQQKAESVGAFEESSSSIGMGDLRRFEAQQALAATRLSSSQLPDRGCASLSTAYGERDAGASAPAYVLRAQGCLPDTVK